MPARLKGGTSTALTTSAAATRPPARLIGTRSVRVTGGSASKTSARASSIGSVSLIGRIRLHDTRPLCLSRRPICRRMSASPARRIVMQPAPRSRVAVRFSRVLKLPYQPGAERALAGVQAGRWASLRESFGDVTLDPLFTASSELLERAEKHIRARKGGGDPPHLAG